MSNNTEQIRSLEARIRFLEQENESLRKRRVGGRQRHNEEWRKLHEQIVNGLKNGDSVDEIAQKVGVNARTVFRHRAYFYAENGVQ